jgi:hypothetical protein
MHITIDIDPDQPRTQADAAATTDVAAPSGMAAVDAGPPSASQLAAVDAGPPPESLLAAIAAAGLQHPTSTTPPAPLTTTSQDASGGAAPT